MINTSVHHPQKPDMTLSSAILVYTNGPESLATIHPMEVMDGLPVCKPGRLVTRQDMNLLSQSLNKASADQWISDDTLIVGSEFTVWWTSAQKRAMHFASKSLCDNKEPMSAVTSIPALIWARTDNNLYVFAICGNERPTKETQLYQAPFFNVSSKGLVCLGSTIVPKGEQASINANWVDAFFGSLFTHPGLGMQNLIEGTTLEKFWLSQLTKPPKAFPQKSLVRLKATVGNLIRH